MSNRHAYTDGMPVPFVDIAITMAMIFLLMFAITPKSEPKKATTETPVPKAEMLVELSWPDGSQNDLDLYVRDPAGNVVFFSNRRTGAMYIDQDDLGIGNTYVMQDGETKAVASRVEIVTIRGLIAGTYTANVHEYKQHVAGVEKVRVKITKLNPYSVISDSQYDFDTQGQERTFANFTVDANGNVTDVYQEQVQLVGEK